jgi:hypothetical protein
VFVGVAELTVAIPGARSLKERRSVVNAMKGRIQSRFNASVSEVGDPELWQRAVIGVSVVGGEASRVTGALDAILRVAEAVRDGQILEVRKDVVPWSFGEWKP